MEDANGAARSVSPPTPSSPAPTSRKQRRTVSEHSSCSGGDEVSFPDAALEHLFPLIYSNSDRNSVSLVCKRWYFLERLSRHHVCISKCNAISPQILIKRFTNVRSLTITGTMSFSLPSESDALPWISVMLTGYLKMEEIVMNNMLVTDEDLELIGGNLKNLRGLSLRRCRGFSTVGLSSVTANCKNLTKLHLSAFDDDTNEVSLVSIFASCTELQELTIRFFELNYLTEQGIVSIAMSCPKLHSIVCDCSSMTNSALLSIADQLPNLSCLNIILDESEYSADHLTDEALDTGFAAILERCKNLKHLWLSSVVITERLLESIGTHGKKLETLELLSIKDVDWGLHHIVAGCTSLRSLIVEYCDFGDEALLSVGYWLETLESLRMVSCPVKYRVCKLLKERYPRLVFEVNNQKMPLLDVADESLVDRLHIYKTVV